MFGYDDMIMGAMAIGSTVLTMTGAFGLKNAQKEYQDLQWQEEHLRRQQMEFNSMMEKRQMIRNAQMTRAVALSNETSSGASTGTTNTGSAVGGFAGQAQGQEGSALFKNFKNLQIGEGLFDVNEREASAKARMERFKGLSSLGSSIGRAAGPASRIGATIFGNMDQTFSGPTSSPGSSENFSGPPLGYGID